MARDAGSRRGRASPAPTPRGHRRAPAPADALPPRAARTSSGAAAARPPTAPARRRRWRGPTGALHGPAPRARAERQRAQGADLPLQGAPQPAQGDGARRRHRRLARGHPPQERDGQLLQADQGRVYALDGAQIYAKTDEAELGDKRSSRSTTAQSSPGNHTLSVAIAYQGNGFGVFSYLKGYKFTVKSSHTFVAGESKSTDSRWSASRRATSRPRGRTSRPSSSA